MAAISKIRYTNVIYENGGKRYNDEQFTCAGHNTAILLENGGGKTVFIQAALQAILPHTDLGDRKAKETFVLEGSAAHIAIEWIISDKPRRYGLTAVTLYLQNNELRSYKYAYEYGVEDKMCIENLPFTREEGEGLRAATRVEMNEYYQRMSKEFMAAKTFGTTKEFHHYIEEQFKIIPEEWRSITVINGGEGSVEAFFDGCKTTTDLVEKLLLPTVEQGLVGQGTEAFAGTFESQREHFNKHKQLERSIRESEKIKAEIEGYVTHFVEYNDSVQAYESKKEEAKALWQLIEQKEGQIKSKLQNFEQEKKQLEQQKKSFQKETAIIQVLETQNTLEVAGEKYKIENAQYTNTKDKKEEKENRRHILKLSRFQNNMKEAQSKIKVYEEQLVVLDEDTEVEGLKEALEENSGELKGHFEEQLQMLGKEMSHCEREKECYLDEQKEQEEKRKHLNRKLQELRGEASKLLGKLEHQQKQLTQIKMAMVAQGAHEDLERQEKEWKQRLIAIDENKHELTRRLRLLEQVQQVCSQGIHEKTALRTQILEKMSRIEVQIQQLEQVHQRVVEEVKLAVPMLGQLPSLYLKPQQVIATLEEQIEKLTGEKEEALLLERRHAHFLENYQTHDFFTVEPLLESWVEKWSNQFRFLQTGTAFIAGLEDKALKQKMHHHPKWAQLVIVSDEDEGQLLQHLEAQMMKLTYPVGIVTQTQAKTLLGQEKLVDNLVYPTAWSENMQTEVFAAHKQEATKALEEAMIYRKQKEKTLQRMEQLLEKVLGFLETYSHEVHARIREENDDLRRQELGVSQKIGKTQNELIDAQKEIKWATETLRKEVEEKNRLQGYVDKVMTYLAVQKECSHEGIKVKNLQEAIKEEENSLSKVEYNLKNNLEALEEVKENAISLRSSENRIKDDPLYKEVQDEKAIYTHKDLMYLRDKQEQLKEALSNKQKGRSEIESFLKHYQKTYEENEKSFNQQVAEREQVSIIIPEYREVYEQEMARLAEEVAELKKQLDSFEQQVKEAKTDFDKKEQEYQSKHETYERDYGPLTNEDKAVLQDKERLVRIDQELVEKEKYLSKQISGLERELKVVLEHKQQLDKKDELHKFCAPEVNVGALDEKIEQEFIYELKVRVIVTDLLERLKTLKDGVERGKKAIEEKQGAFKLFCQSEIRDSKLRNMAIQGIMQKQNYEALVIWKENIVERINHTLTIIERDLVDQDQQISQFIIHLYAYLKSVASELTEIPKNTQVNTEEGWKAIYEFVIPTWQEDSGKEKIRTHIYRLLDDIEGDSFFDDLGKEDLPKVKKYIKEQFKLRNLLKVVMGNDAIRVRCRKVSNISDVSNQRYSWETSNKWSGGEKWSKNMALYLGILNYLAEKKQNIHNEEQKVRRAVILDNPFGKASSGHVLEPVFFIAKQLGFQIIALTAHSEGDFIRRYFPIVYSCKLRSTIDQQTAVFAKEQEISKAYFMDNDPVALSVLGSNQLSLFV